MRWTPGRMSRNIEDRRGARGGGIGMMGPGMGGVVLLLVLGQRSALPPCPSRPE